MDVQRRDLISHATLVFYEISLVPLSFLATFFALLFVGGVLSATQLAGETIGVGATTLDLLSALASAVMVVLLSSAGGTMVRGYQRYFDRSFGRLELFRICSVPLIATVASTGYAVVHLGTIAPPWWVSLIAFVSVHALVFRAIAVHSMLDGAKQTGARVGAVAALPIVLTLITLVTQEVLNAGMNGAGQQIDSTLTALGIPREPATLVLAPLMIAAAYGITARDDEILSGFPQASFPSGFPQVSLPITVDSSILDRQWWPSGSDRPSRASAGSSKRPESSSAPPPSSPHTSDSTGRSSSKSSEQSGGPARSAFRGGGSKSTNGSNSASSGARDPPTGSSADSESNTGSGANRANEAAGGASSGSKSSEDSPSSPDESATAPSAAADGTGSETRIFTDDFGEYTTGGDAATCSDCDTEVPSDGTYCPQCGAEL